MHNQNDYKYLNSYIDNMNIKAFDKKSNIYGKCTGCDTQYTFCEVSSNKTYISQTCETVFRLEEFEKDTQKIHMVQCDFCKCSKDLNVCCKLFIRDLILYRKIQAKVDEIYSTITNTVSSILNEEASSAIVNAVSLTIDDEVYDDEAFEEDESFLPISVLCKETTFKEAQSKVLQLKEIANACIYYLTIVNLDQTITTIYSPHKRFNIQNYELPTGCGFYKKYVIDKKKEVYIISNSFVPGSVIYVRKLANPTIKKSSYSLRHTTEEFCGLNEDNFPSLNQTNIDK